MIHADKHGFLAIPEEDEDALLKAAQFMDSNECNFVIEAARSTAGLTIEQILENLNNASKKFRNAARKHFGKDGEW